MATIVNNPAERTERVVETSGGGWAVAVIVLVAVIAIGAFVWMRYYSAPAAMQTQTPGSAQINLTLPSGGSQSGGDTSGSGSTDTSGSGSTNQPAAQ